MRDDAGSDVPGRSLRRALRTTGLVSIACLCAAAGSCEAPDRPVLFPARTYALDLETRAVSAVDVDGDSIADLVAVAGDRPVVLRGVGNGTFSDPELLPPLSGRLGSATTGDVNADGAVDIVVTEHLASSVRVYLGTGDGAFLDGARFLVGSRPSEVRTADVDVDGWPDIVTSNGNSISVLLSRGDGTFDPAITFQPGDSTRSILLNDFDGDDVPDLAIASGLQSRALRLMIGAGDGTFGDAQVHLLSARPTDIVSGDFDGDGNVDVVASAGDELAVLLGDGEGNLEPPIRIATETPVGMLAATDFDSDGRLDLLSVFGGTVATFEGEGNGFFVPIETSQPVRFASSLALADVDGDGNSDLVLTLGFLARGMAVVLGEAAGRFPGSRSFLIGPGTTNPWFVEVDDFDGDRKLDVLTAKTTGLGEVSLLLGAGDGTLKEPRLFPTGARPVAGAVADLDLDGRLDVATANPQAGDLRVLSGRAGGGFSDPVVVALPGEPWDVVAADFDRDGRPDLATADASEDQVHVLIGTPAGFRAPLSFDVGDEPTSIASGDIDSDGLLDLVTANFEGNGVSVLVGRGDGSFLPDGTYPVGREPSSVLVADLDRDGAPDVVTSNLGRILDDDVSVLLGNGDGTLGPARHYVAGDEPTSVAVADLDGDGILDLAVSNGRSHEISVLRGYGDGTFREAESYASSIESRDLVIADMDGDAAPDIALASGSWVTILPNVTACRMPGRGGRPPTHVLERCWNLGPPTAR